MPRMIFSHKRKSTKNTIKAKANNTGANIRFQPGDGDILFKMKWIRGMELSAQGVANLYLNVEK